MICPKCGSENVNVQAVTETKEKRKRGILYWVLIGWWWEPFAWLMFGLIKLLFELFGKHTKISSKTHTEAICQNCGNRWKVSKSDVRNASRPNVQQTQMPQQQGQSWINGETVSSIGSGVMGKLHSPELPFYKRKWFLVTCGIVFPPAGIALVWLVYKDWTTKKKAIVTGVMALWFIIALLVDGGKSETPVASDTDTKIVSSVEIPSASDKDIITNN